MLSTVATLTTKTTATGSSIRVQAATTPRREASGCGPGHHSPSQCGPCLLGRNGLPVLRPSRSKRWRSPTRPQPATATTASTKSLVTGPRRGRDGYRIWRFHLVRLSPDEARPWTPEGQEPATGTVGDYRPDAGFAELDYDPRLGGLSERRPGGDQKCGRRTARGQRRTRSRRGDRPAHRSIDRGLSICRRSFTITAVRSVASSFHSRWVSTAKVLTFAVSAPRTTGRTRRRICSASAPTTTFFSTRAPFTSMTDSQSSGTTGAPLAVFATHAQHRLNRGYLRHHREHHGFGT